ncbi:RHS repeat-associated core domain-containing protein [Argonema antarcticum]|uniref:RHS repeat-associated core domain-containing protein n=1 Tax=Argonema antarcticum TaxID=2942763 RepID=UPI002012289D|nr:RHS repeat-associated core domain-containing protein [Argonema antarcticum]MCL1474223.1 RHS repeat-associated core domain-containing protein [Argonema antarcticum A004/B2]
MVAKFEVISYQYDSDGVRVSSTVNGVKTEYLVDKNLPYAQVLEERVNNGLTAGYVYGNDLISQQRGSDKSFYLVDGLGSTRGLTNGSGVVTDRYSYDAFGNLIGSGGNSENNYLFAGEQFDRSLGDYYLRARYYDTDTGRFTRRDSYEGDIFDPVSLHKFLYGNANPVNSIDPSGLSTLYELAATTTLAGALAGGTLGATAGVVSGGGWNEILMSTGRGALGGAAGGLALGLGSPLIGSAIGAVVGTGFWGGVLSGVVGGGLSGAAGNLAVQGFDLATGTEQNFQIESLVIATFFGSVFGGLFLRSAAPSPGQEVTRWSAGTPQGFQEGRRYWVQLGRNDWLNSQLTGRGSLARFIGQPVYPSQNSVSVSVIQANRLSYPDGMEIWKGLMGQRIYRP